MEEFLGPTLEELNSEQAPEPTGNYQVLKSLVSGATGVQQVEENFSFDQMVNDSYRTIAKVNNAADALIMQERATSGDTTGATMAMQNINNRLAELSTEQGNRQARLKEIAQTFLDNIATSNANVVVNNPPEKLAATQPTASTAVIQAQLDKVLEDVSNETGGFIKNAFGILQEFLPTAALSGLELDSFIKKTLGPDAVSFWDLQSRGIEKLQAYYKGLSDEEKAAFAQDMYNSLRDSMGTSSWLAATRVMEVVSGESPDWVDEAGDILQKIGAPASLLNVYGVLKGLQMVKRGVQVASVERELAKVGGKQAVVDGVGQRIAARGAAKVVGQATGISDIADAVKLAAHTSAKLLPEAITTASSELQAILKNQVDTLRSNIFQTVKAGNVRPEEAAIDLADIAKRYDPSTNKSIHTFDVDSTGKGRIVFQAPDGKSFVNRADAEAAIKRMDPSNSMGLRVIPDTTNVNFLVEANTITQKTLEKNAYEAQLLALLKNAEEKLKTKAPKKEAVPTTESPSVTGKNINEEVKGLFEAEKARLPGMALPNDITLFKAEGMPTWSTDEKKVREWALANRQGVVTPQVRAIAVDKATADSLSKLPTKAQWDQVEWDPYEDMFDAEGNLQQEAFEQAVLANEIRYGEKYDSDALQKFINGTKDGTIKGMTKVGNAYLSPSMSSNSGVVHIVDTMAKKLGLENQPLVVVQWQDLTKSDDPFTAYMGKAFARSSPTAAAYYTKMPGDDGAHVIVMKIQAGVKDYSKEKFIADFAHEYGHFFEDVWTVKYGRSIYKAYKEWRATMGLPKKISNTKITKVDRVSFISTVRQNELLKNTPIEEYDDLIEDPEWYMDAGEYFAEQFSKWMFSDAIPETVVDTAFATIVRGIKTLANEVAKLTEKLFGIDLSEPDLFITKFMNEHVKRIKSGNIMVPPAGSALDRTSLALPYKDVREGGGATRQAQYLRSQIERLDSEIAAMRSARDGLVHGWLIERPVNPTLRYSDLAGYKPEDVSSLVRWSLGDWALGTSSELYANRVVGIAQSSRYQKILTEFIRGDLEKLSRIEKQLLSDVLVRGDKEGVVFDSGTLRGMGANQKVELAYYKVRALRDELYNMRNSAAVDSLTRKGYVSLYHPNLADDDNPYMFSKEVGVDAIRGKRVYNADEKNSVVVTNSIEESISRGETAIYELKDVGTFGGSRHRYVLAKRSATRANPITRAIPYRTGEYKRIYSDEYFVKLEGTTDVDGVQTEVKWTHRTAAKKGEAEAYIKDMNNVIALHRRGELTREAAASMQKWGWTPESLITQLSSGEWDNLKLVVNYNRTEDDYIEEGIATTRGFSQERGTRIPSVYGEDTVNTVNPIDSIAAEITNTAFMVPITEWRDVAVYRWFATVKDALPAAVAAMKPEEAFYFMVNNKGRYIGDDQLKLFAQRVQDYVTHELTITSREEQSYLGAMRRVSEAVEGKFPNNKAISWIGQKMRTDDPITFGRTLAFHSMLGGLNPVQLLVQGMNAFNAFSISPKFGTIAAKNAPLLRIALMSDREDVWRAVATAEKLSSLGLSSADEFVETVRAIRRSGLLDGINTTSLYNVESGKWSLFNKWTRKATGTSAFFFNRGEELSRITSFDIARREYIAANPGRAWWDDVAINKIIERQDDLTQNMTRANMASWQKGVLSIPMQFMQYNVKIFMNVLASFAGNKRAFSRPEVARLMVGHTLMFGVAGMGLGRLLNEVIGEQTQELSPEQMLYVQQGVVAGVINSASIAMGGEGVALALGSRLNTFDIYGRIVDGIFTSGDDVDAPTVRDVLSGALGASAVRFFGNMGDAIHLFYHNDDITMETVTEALTLMGTGSFSSLNNLHKSYLASNALNYVQSKAGRSMYKVNDAERMLLAVGIPPASAADFEYLMKDKKHRDAMYKDVSKEIARHQTLALAAYNSGDIKAYKDHKNVVSAIYAGLNVHDRIKIDKLLAKSWVGSRQRELLIERLIKDVETTPPIINRSAGDVR